MPGQTGTHKISGLPGYSAKFARKNLRDEFLLVPICALIEGRLRATHGTSEQRALVRSCLRNQDMADACSNILLILQAPA